VATRTTRPNKGDPPRERLRQHPAARPRRAAPAAGLEPAVARPAAVRRPARIRPAQYGGQPQYEAQPQYGQPYGAPYGQPGTPPPNYLVWAILTLIFCCWPLSIASIVFAAQVNGKYAAGDLAGAQESSRKAKQFALWSAIAACVLFGLLIALFIVGAVAGSNSNP
jgi:hypothetical protein